ncbi:MAG: ParB/RepB/Spo0J family partition protein [Planctomycetes bacterium]|nr:ParB/RepB/Spo0J family partition protein [Planctomycetota bacterium]
MTKERRLGRGLEALLGRLPDAPIADHGATHADSAPTSSPPSQGPARLPVDLIDTNPFQPRFDFDDAELQNLAQSIQQHGLLQPITVRRAGDRYQLVAGERRLRAAALAGWRDISAQVVEADDRQMAELGIVENLQRQDLNPLEKATSFQQYLQRYQCTQDELASRLQLDRSTVANLIRLLELPEEVQVALRKGQITQGHARAILPLGDEREQVALCRQIQSEGLSVRAVESLVQATVHQGEREELGVADAPEESAPKRSAAKRNEQLAVLEQELRTALGTKVELRHGARGRGKVIVHFSNADEFERLRRHFHGQQQMRRAG